MLQGESGRPSRQPRIGFITPRITQHGLTIWQGMLEAARERGVDVVCFAGGEVGHPQDAPATASNVLYDLVDRQSLDGLVVWGSSLGYYTGPEATERFCRRFEPLPLVSIGVSLPGIPGIVLDSYGGMAQAITHLITVHGRRRLAFIRGPETHREARERFRSYCDTLARHGIPFDPHLVSPPYLWVQADGTELQVNGGRAVDLFLDERSLDVDAVIAASDTFALGALTALQARGVRVPEDIAVVGFDDRPVSQAATPPLTTVKISMQERGRRAVAMLLARLAGETTPAEVSLPAHLVVRRSCGCFDPSVTGAGHAGEGRGGAEARLRAELAAIGEPEACGTRLLAACSAELDGERNALLTALDEMLRDALEAGRNVAAWQEVLTSLREWALREPLPDQAAGRGERARRTETLLHEARVLVSERAWRAQTRAAHDAGLQADRLHAISQSLSLAVTVPELMDILAAELPALGIACGAVALFEGPRIPTGDCRLVLAFDEQGRIDLPPQGEACGASRMASGGLPERSRGGQDDGRTTPRALIVQPLFCRDEPLGFILLDGSRSEGQIYHTLQEHLSTALKGVLLLQENVRLYKAALAAQQVAQERQRAAEEADQLKSRFLSMVSHELRTPLILLEGLSEMMLRQDLARGKGPGGRPPLPDAYRQDLARIQATAQQLGGLVRDVLDLARSQVGQLRLALKPLDIAEALQPALLLGEQLARSKGLDWQVNIAAELPRVFGDAARLQEMTLNLISNAVKFTARGQVRLGITVEDGDIVVAISDTGLGVPLEEQDAIFDEFRQSERTAARGFGGLGVGLAICREIVRLHGGEIDVSSSGLVDGGSTFYYRLPALDDSPPASAAAQGDPGRSEAAAQTVVLLTEQAAGSALLRAHLQEQGFEVEVLPVEENEDWLAQLLARKPGAVVLDLQPTWERGWQIFDSLRQSDATREIPVLLYSLLAGQDGREAASGGVLALDYLAKPVGPDALAHALHHLGLASNPRRNQTILIADDDPEIVALHAGMVREHFPGCAILTAENGAQALEILRRGPPLFVLLDLMMPEVDGIGVLAAMQEDPRLRDVPVIVVTAHSLRDADMERLGRSVSSILQKGVFTAEEALARVQVALSGNRRLGSDAQRLARKVMAYIHVHYAEDLSRERLASHAGLSERHLTRCFTQEVGLSPGDYLNRYRVAQARRLLDEGHTNITEIMSAVGFGDSSYFSRVFRREVGMSPTAYRNQSASTTPR